GLDLQKVAQEIIKRSLEPRSEVRANEERLRELVSQLQSPDQDIRIRAVTALENRELYTETGERFGPIRSFNLLNEVVTALMKALDDPDPKFRREGSRTVGSLQNYGIRIFKRQPGESGTAFYARTVEELSAWPPESQRSELRVNHSQVVKLTALALSPDAGRVILAKIDSGTVQQIIEQYRKDKQELRSELREKVDSVKYTAQQIVMNNLDARMTELKDPSFAIATTTPKVPEGNRGAMGYFWEGYFDGIDGRVSEMLIDGKIPEIYRAKLAGDVNFRNDLNVIRPSVLQTSTQASVPVAMFTEPAHNEKIHSMFTPVFINDLSGLMTKLSKDPDAPQKLRWLGKLASRTEIHLADLSQVTRLKTDPNALKAELLRRLDLEGYDLIAISQNGGRSEIRINAIQADLAFSALVRRTLEAAA
ncbi:MAG TPA: hypothetical protein VD913_03755, partial [bacterium]|nr:hypothetical protein [bacterium]